MPRRRASRGAFARLWPGPLIARRVAAVASAWAKLPLLSKAVRGRDKTAAVPARMSRRRFDHAGERRAYWLFMPPGWRSDASMPLLVMLHGCAQKAMDFAKASRMDEVAAERGFAVAWPEQTEKANRMRCWNWFEPHHQGRRGESAMIALLALDAARKARADLSRIYIGGLSAGGAMALTVAGSHPEIFAAVASHSGVPEGAARDVFSGMRVMKHGASTESLAASAPVPTIVLHGARDRTVHPRNAQATAAAAVQAFRAAGVRLAEQTLEADAGRAVVSRMMDADGVAQVERWLLRSVAHAWSGGSAAGSFADPLGADAARAIADFLLRHRKAA